MLTLVWLWLPRTQTATYGVRRRVSRYRVNHAAIR